LREPGIICEEIRKSNSKIRHVGYCDKFGRILNDSTRENTPPMESIEEQHILNARVAITLSVWKPADSVIGSIEAFIMMMNKLIGLFVPHSADYYFLVIFESGVPLEDVEKARYKLQQMTAGS